MDGQGDSSDGSGGIDLGGGRPSIDISSSARAVSSAPKRKVRGPYDRKIADAGEHVALFLLPIQNGSQHRFLPTMWT